MTDHPRSAFLSYSRSDDRDKKVSAIKDHLVEEVRRLTATGERFEIFIDTEGIHTSDQWASRIDDELSRADLLIVVVTPTMLTSENCRHEVERFRRVESRSAGPNNRIFPILYTGIELLSKKAQAENRDLIDLLVHQRHRTDWRGLRYASTDSVEFQKAIGTLATEVATRLRELPDPVVAEPPARDDDRRPRVLVGITVAAVVLLLATVFAWWSTASSDSGEQPLPSAGSPSSLVPVEDEASAPPLPPSESVDAANLRGVRERLSELGLEVEIQATDPVDQPIACSARPTDGILSSLLTTYASCRMYRAVLVVSGMPGEPGPQQIGVVWLTTDSAREAEALQQCVAAPRSGSIVQLSDLRDTATSPRFSSNVSDTTVIQADVGTTQVQDPRAPNDPIQRIADKVTEGDGAQGTCPK